MLGVRTDKGLMLYPSTVDIFVNQILKTTNDLQKVISYIVKIAVDFSFLTSDPVFIQLLFSWLLLTSKHNKNWKKYNLGSLPYVLRLTARNTEVEVFSESHNCKSYLRSSTAFPQIIFTIKITDLT